MVWLRNKYGGWFEIPDEDYKPSGEKMGQSALHAAKIGTRVVDGNGNIWRKTSDDLPWHNEKNDDKASDYALAQLKEYKGVRELKEEKSITDKNEELKEKQIAKTKEEVEKLNKKEQDYSKVGPTELEAAAKEKFPDSRDYLKRDAWMLQQNPNIAIKWSNAYTKEVKDYIKEKQTERLIKENNSKNLYKSVGVSRETVINFLKNNPQARAEANKLLESGKLTFDEASVMTYQSFIWGKIKNNK